MCKVCQPLPDEPPRPGERPDRFPHLLVISHKTNKSNPNQDIYLKILSEKYVHLSLSIFLIPEYLKVRSHDPEEAIRHDVIVTIINAGKKDLNLVNDQLLGFVRERTLDKRVSLLYCWKLFGIKEVCNW